MDQALNTPVAPSARLTFKSAVAFLRRYQNAVIFLSGFIFDFITIKRIDSLLDILYQLFYLLLLTVLLVFQYREHRGLWKPGSLVGRVWHYNVEVLHFIYGGLLNNYIVLYFKSSSGARPIVFFFLLIALLGANEMPQIRRYGYRLRLGLYAFCLVSFMIYFVPILLGMMGTWVFLLSIGLSTAAVWGVARLLAAQEPDVRAAQQRLFLPAAAVLGSIVLLYALRLIPPVPLSIQAQGIYHGVERADGGYLLRAQKPPFYLFWRRDSRPFRMQAGDKLYYFVRVFAPSRFKHRVMIRWEFYDERSKRYVTSDRIPLSVVGGRDEGFRGAAVKSNFGPGRWRVWTETEDGRTIGVLPFTVLADADTGVERRWIETRM